MLLWLDIVIILNEMSGMVCFLTSAVLFLWFLLFDVFFVRDVGSGGDKVQMNHEYMCVQD